MGDAGEGLVDAESRLAERMEEREEEKRKARQAAKGGDPERLRQLESLRLANARVEAARAAGLPDQGIFVNLLFISVISLAVPEGRRKI